MNVINNEKVGKKGLKSEIGNGNLFQYSCLGNSMDRGTLGATVNHWGHKELDTTE